MGDWVRGWVKGEGDFVASTKEAEQAGQQLIKERETLAEKIQKLKVPFKRMITHLEMEETSIKQTADRWIFTHLVQLNEKGPKFLIFMHLHCFIVSKNSHNACTFSV